jgi:hypothetical protein
MRNEVEVRAAEQREEVEAVRVSEEKKESRPEARQALSPGQWMRAVLGFEAPFGHDGLPTVWG